MNKYFNETEITDILSKHRRKVPAKGIDKIGISSIRKNIDFFCKVIITKCLENRYEFSPYLELLKPKSREQYPRLISIPTIRDRIVLTIINRYLSNALKGIVNKKNISFEIRKISNLFSSQGRNNIYFVKIDISSYYPSIDRNILLKILDKYISDKTMFYLIQKSIFNTTVPRDYKKEDIDKYRTSIGIPQGIPISNILAELYLSEIDEIDCESQVFQIRWVDDILILGSNEISVFKRSQKIQKILSTLKLEINHNKSQCTPVKLTNIKFLGYNLSQTQISISQTNVEKFLQNLAKKLTLFKHQYENMKERPKYLSADEALIASFIEILNERITGAVSEKSRYGWLFYFSETTDKSQIYFVEKKILEMTSKLKFIPISKLKKLSKAYFEIKYNFKDSEYFHNYDSYESISKKIKFLSVRGHISTKENYSNEEINELFEKYKRKNLSELEKDVSYQYI